MLMLNFVDLCKVGFRRTDALQLRRNPRTAVENRSAHSARSDDAQSLCKQKAVKCECPWWQRSAALTLRLICCEAHCWHNRIHSGESGSVTILVRNEAHLPVARRRDYYRRNAIATESMHGFVVA